MDGDLVKFLKSIKPFDVLSKEEIDQLAAKMNKREFQAGTIIYSQKKSVVDAIFIVASGRIEKFLINRKKEKKFIEEIGVGETLGEISILLNKGKAVCSVIAPVPTTVYELDSEDFYTLCQRNKHISNYFTERVGKRMFDDVYGLFHSQVEDRAIDMEGTDVFFTQKIKSINPREIVSCQEKASIREAAQMMTDDRTGCILIINESGEYTGYVTDFELRNKVIATGKNVDEPVRDILATPISTIDEEELVYEALIKMFIEKLNYLVVERKGKYVGLITRDKLLSSKARSPFVLIQSIKLANSTVELASKWKNVPFVVHQLLVRGVKAEVINELIAAFVDAIMVNCIERTLKELAKHPVKFCFIVLNAGGRKEYSLKNRQHTAIIFEDLLPNKRDVLKNYFLMMAQFVVEALEEVGFPAASEALNASDEIWCDSLKEYKVKFKSWINSKTENEMGNAVNILDSRPIFGERALHHKLMENCKKAVNNSENFLALLRDNMKESKSPLTLFRGFQLVPKETKKNALDINAAMEPIADFIRLCALSNKIYYTNTGDRLTALLESGKLPKEEYYELLQAYYFMMQLKLKYQVKAIVHENSTPDDLIDPSRLTNIERVTLKTAFKVVEDRQSGSGFDLRNLFKK